MAEGFTLQATARDRVGKGAARQLRRDGLIPAVIYGGKQPPLPIAIPYKETFLRLHQGGFKTHVWTIDVGGQQIKALARDYQLEPVRDFLVHVDFLRVTESTRAVVDVPVTFLNEREAPGLRTGGVLNVVAHTLPLDCPASAIPEHVEVDLSGLEVGATIHVSDLVLPAGVSIAAGGEDITVATSAAPSEEGGDEAAEADDEAGGEA